MKYISLFFKCAIILSAINLLFDYSYMLIIISSLSGSFEFISFQSNEMAPYSEIGNEKCAVIMALNEKGYSTREIAKKTDVNQSTVVRTLQRN